jgi:hypothetical protein
MKKLGISVHEDAFLDVMADGGHRYGKALLREAQWLRTNNGADFQAQVMGGGLYGTDTNLTGTASSITATTLVSTLGGWTGGRYTGHYVFASSPGAGATRIAYGVIITNTATMLTIDQWYDPNTIGGVAAVVPTFTSAFVIAMGGAPAFWMALSNDTVPPTTTDAQLVSELTDTGLARAVATYAHSTGVNTYTLTKTFTESLNTTRIIQKVGIVNTATNFANQLMLFETAVPSPPTLVQNDQLTVTETVTI